MSDSNSPLYNKKEFSLVSRAIEEFNKTSTKSDENGNQSLRKGANPPKKRSVLGRGLSALMSPTTTVDITLNSSTPASTLNTSETQADLNTKITEPGTQYQNIPIDQLVANPTQPRTTFDQKEIRELASSIRKSGLLQPLLVRKKTNSNSAFSSYEIVAGERRWRAAKEAGLITVPAIVKDLGDHETLEISIVENIQRQDLNPIEEAIAYDRLINEFGSTQEQISQSLGKDRSSIANSLRLLKLPESVKELLKQKKLTAGHARAILSLESQTEQEELANLLTSEKLSVREAERLASEKRPSVSKNKSLPSIKDLGTSSNTALEDRLRRALGTKVKVNLSASGKGEVKISFFSRAEFEAFLDKVKA